VPRPPARAQHARVARVVDGDTIVLTGIDAGDIDKRTGGRRARLIGIDTPEVHGQVECMGREASAFTQAALDGREVLVDLDVERLDRYARALVYVWLTDGTFFNARLASEGYALPLTIPPDVRYADLFVALAAEARDAGRGLWSRC
jgi:micrococcal nuclease